MITDRMGNYGLGEPGGVETHCLEKLRHGAGKVFLLLSYMLYDNPPKQLDLSL